MTLPDLLIALEALRDYLSSSGQIQLDVLKRTVETEFTIAPTPHLYSPKARAHRS